ncbi:MAG TPA: hypothetical protein VF069_20525 [Streptosporangiaceae bacterium]
MNAPARPRPARAIPFVILLLFGMSLLVVACVRETNKANQPPEPQSVTTSAPPAAQPPATTPTTPPGRRPAGAPPAPPAAAALPRLPGRYLPLWPFANGREVRAWQASYRSGGHQPWHLSAQQTALSFARGYLGYTEINRVSASTVSGGDAHIGVGFKIPDGGRMGTAAVIHLVRFGSGRLAPWEVVGTDDTTFSLTTPPYGGHVGTRPVVGGRITGVDESISIQVRLPSGALVGAFGYVSAGGQDQPWSARVTLRGAPHGVLTIAAATGGHLAGVERFTVTGAVR